LRDWALATLWKAKAAVVVVIMRLHAVQNYGEYCMLVVGTDYISQNPMTEE
jgi:hypothetical protein